MFFIHTIIFTVGLQPLIEPEWAAQLHDYLRKAANKLRSPVIAVNGMSEHVHILVSLSPNISIDKLVKNLKTDSTDWIQRTLNKQLDWDEGYGAFSVGGPELESIKTFIKNQKEHHSEYSFREEYEAILTAHEIEFDPETLFD